MATPYTYQVGSTVQGIYYSTNYGQTWAQSNITTGYGTVKISYDGQYGIRIDTDNNITYYSTNYGQTWSTTQPAGWSSSLFSYRFTTSVDALTVTNANGYVGIGKTNPGYTLDVAGSLGIAGGITLSSYGSSIKSIWTTTVSPGGSGANNQTVYIGLPAGYTNANKIIVTLTPYSSSADIFTTTLTSITTSTIVFRLWRVDANSGWGVGAIIHATVIELI